MKKTFLSLNILFLLLLGTLSACQGGKDQQEQGRIYQVSGVIEADSTVVLDSLLLFADNHSSLRVDTLELDQEHRFTSQFSTAGFDELYLCSEAGELCRFYATEGMEVELSLTMGEKGLKPSFARTETDSINAWLQEQDSLLSAKSESDKREHLSSLLAGQDTLLRTTILLRNHIMELNDSLFVRQFLGGLPASAKPEWLIKTIDRLLDEKSEFKDRHRRMEPASFAILNDSVFYNTGSSRSDYLLVYFWADFSMPSLDSLKMLTKLMKEEYGEKRVQLLTCCLHATDSTWWKLRTLNMEGRHTWVQGGMADPRIADWGIQEVPSVMLLDMYNNRQLRNEWGEKLRKALDRLPKKAPSI